MTSPAAPPPSDIAGATPLEPWLRAILRCPACRSEVRDDAGPTGPELVCTSSTCGLAYRIDDGVPVLLVDEARRPG
ncbi:MAG: Trm112 family protein [Dermatophilaceae bacterium]